MLSKLSGTNTYTMNITLRGKTMKRKVQAPRVAGM